MARGASYQHIDSLEAARGVGASPSSVVTGCAAVSSGISVTGHTSGQVCGDEATFGALAHEAALMVASSANATVAMGLVIRCGAGEGRDGDARVFHWTSSCGPA